MQRILNVFLVLFMGLAMGFLPATVTAGRQPSTLVYSWPSNAGPLNPHLYSPNQMYAQAMVYEPLVRYSASGEIQPWLAQSWTISPDGREYTFNLRKNVYFSDGTPFDAHAVKKNNDTVTANKKRHSWLEMINQIQETEVIDTHTVKVRLKSSYYPFLQDLALVRPMRYLSPSGFPDSGNTVDGIKAAVGTGPWILAESRLGEYDIFQRNENYWGPKPEIEKIIVKVLPDPNTRAIAFETNDIDLIYGDGQINLDTYKRYRADRRYTTKVSEPLATRAVALNSNRGPTRDLAVRKAIQHAVDKDGIIEGVFLGTEVKADTLYADNVPYARLDLPVYAYDPGYGAQLLENAGWKKSANSPYRSRGNEQLSVDLCFVGNNAVMKSMAEVLQANLKQIGIRVNLMGEEPDSFYRRQKEGEFNLIFNDSWGAPYEPHSFLSSWRVPSHADYQAQMGLPMKDDIHRAIGQVLVTVDETQRQEYYKFILGTIHDQAVYLPISYTTSLIVHGDRMIRADFGATKNEIPFETMRLK